VKTPPPPPKVNNVIPLQKVTIRSQAVLDSVADLPRKHLGHAYYHSNLKPDPLVPKRDFTTSRGFASTPQPLPRFEGNENSTFTVKVMRAYLDHKSREEITIRRAVWGTDIYTDDSDIVAACIHQGWFKGAWQVGIDEGLLGLEITEDGAIPHFQPLDEIWTKPPPSGPADVPQNRDLNVNILILPLLDKYSSVTRFGIRSREWGGNYDGYHSVHDGLSFMIQSIQWVDGVDGVQGRSVHDRRDILAQEQREADLDAARALGELILNGDGNGNRKPQFEESFERGGDGPEQNVGEIRGLGMGSWWKKPNGVHKKEPSDSKMASAAIVAEEGNGVPPPLVPVSSAVLETIEGAPEPESLEPQDPDQQQEQSRRISRVTQLMIANANSSEGVAQPVTPTRAEIQAPTPSPISPVQPHLEIPAKSEGIKHEGGEETGETEVEDTDMDTTL
jgi:Histone deacetylation protein Rxt3